MSIENAPLQSGELEPEKNKIIERIEKEAEMPNLLETLVKIPSGHLQSLLLEITSKRAENIGVKEVNTALENNPFVELCEVGQKAFLDFDRIAYDVLPKDYLDVELSPLVPFATNNALTGISQKNILSTIRTTETTSDPTTALALYLSKERARKIRIDSKDSNMVKMATSQRVIRQGKIKKEGYGQHFRLFTLGAAGRDIGNRNFEKCNLKEQLGYFFKLFRKLNKDNGFTINNIKASLSDVSESPDILLNIMDETVIKELREEFPEINFEADTTRKSNYYKNLCYSIFAENSSGQQFSIAGGGITDWSEILTGSKKERLLVGSVGSEIICRHFKNK